MRATCDLAMPDMHAMAWITLMRRAVDKIRGRVPGGGGAAPAAAPAPALVETQNRPLPLPLPPRVRVRRRVRRLETPLDAAV